MNAKEVLRTLHLIHGGTRNGGDSSSSNGNPAVCEVRILGTRQGTISGYYSADQFEKLARDISPWDGKGDGIYITLNPVLPDLLARCCSQLKPYARQTTSDAEITSRRWLFIDADPMRPKGIPATEEEHHLALARAKAVRDYLVNERGWSEPIEADSGNGGHLLFAIDLPNDEDSRDLVRGVIQALRSLFNDEKVEIDDKTFNAARICKLYGTIAAKGDSVPSLGREHRTAHLLHVPDKLRVVPREQLEEIAAPANSPTWEDEEAAETGEAGRPDQPLGSVAEIPDKVLLEKARRAANGMGAMFDRLWHGDDSDVDGDASDGDYHLCRMLAFWTQRDYARIERLFGQSSRSARAKWSDRDDYRDRTISKAIAKTTSVYDPGAQMPPEEQPEDQQEGGFAGFAGTPQAVSVDFSGVKIRPVKAELLPVARLTPEMLPGVLRPYVQDIAERVSCPLEYVAVPALVALSAVVGRKVTIRPKKYDTWQVVPNLWGAIIGPPGALKTPAVAEALKPLRRIEIKAREEHECAMKQHEADQLVAKAQAEAAKKRLKTAAQKGGSSQQVLLGIATEAVGGEDEAAPTCHRFTVNDTTVEKLGELMKENPNGLLYERDELAGFFEMLEKPGHEADRSYYLEAWNGDGCYTYDRIGRGTIYIPSVCLSLFGTIQPGPLARYLRKVSTGAQADGLAQRLQLMVYPEPLREFRNVDRLPDRQAKEQAFSVFERLRDLDTPCLLARTEGQDSLPFLHFDEAAQCFFDDWRLELETRLRSGQDSPQVESHLAKYRSLMPSLALLFHLIDGGFGPVPLTAAQRAVAWCDFLESHARRIYHMAQDGDPEAAQRLADRLKQSIPNPFTYRDIAKKGWTGLGTSEEVERVVGILEDRGWVQAVEVRDPRGGRPSVQVFINPEVIGGGAGANGGAAAAAAAASTAPGTTAAAADDDAAGMDVKKKGTGRRDPAKPAKPHGTG